MEHRAPDLLLSTQGAALEEGGASSSPCFTLLYYTIELCKMADSCSATGSVTGSAHASPLRQWQDVELGADSRASSRIAPSPSSSRIVPSPSSVGAAGAWGTRGRPSPPSKAPAPPPAAGPVAFHQFFFFLGFICPLVWIFAWTKTALITSPRCAARR